MKSSNPTAKTFVAPILIVLLLAGEARADWLTKALREAGEAIACKVGSKLSSKAAREGAETAASSASRQAARHVDDATRAIANQGDDAARALSTQPNGAARIVRGSADPAAEMVVHHANEAVSAAATLSGRNASRLAALEASGQPRVSELSEVIRRYGDPAMDFVHRHKGTLAGAAALTAFLANPEPYIKGTTQLAAPPLVAAGDAVRSIADSFGSVLIIVAVGVSLAVFYGAKSAHDEPKRADTARH